MSLSADSRLETVVRLPKLGQSMESATIIQWHAEEGAEVREGQLLVSIETDKATYDLEAPATGRLNISVPEGDEVAIETVLAHILAGAANDRAPATGSQPASPQTKAPPRQPATNHPPSAPHRVLASPRAKRLAEDLGIDLAAVPASATDGVVSAEDVHQFALHRDATPTSPEPSTGKARHEVGRVRLAGAQATMARRLQQAWQEIPHIVQMVDVDASGLLDRRAAYKQTGSEVSVNDLVLHAAAGAMAATPELNVALHGDEVVRFEGVDVGFAVETGRGLYVPVVRGADKLTPDDLAAESARLSTAARNGALRGGDMGGASLTVSNLGAYGVKAGTPVINPGEPVLVFVGAIEDRAVVVNGQLAVRPTFTLSIAYDHRLVGGAGAAAYTVALKRAIEDLAGDAAVATAAPAASRQVNSSSSGASYHVEATGPGGSRWSFDEPVAHGGTDHGPTPVDGFLASLLGCLTISFLAAGRRRRVPIEHIDGRARANLNGAIREIVLELDVCTPAPADEVRALLAPAERGCWVSGALKPEIAYSIELNVIPPRA